MLRQSWCATLALMIGSASATRAAIPALLPVEGALSDSGGPLSGPVVMHFALYDSALGGAALWVEDQTISVLQGQFIAYLGAVEPLPLELFRDQAALWLGVRIAADSEMPRAFLATVPFAAAAEYAASIPEHSHPPGGGPSGTANQLVRFVTPETLGDSVITDLGSAVGVGTTTPTEMLEVNGNVRLGGPTPTHRVTNVAAPIAGSDVATRDYVLAQTAAPIYTILFITVGTANGNMGGRAGADAFCVAQRPAGLLCQNVHAFVSVGETDEIRDMPNNYGYVRTAPLYWHHPDGGLLSKVGEDWGDVLDSSILVSAYSGTGLNRQVRTGSTADGNTSSNCSDFTSAASVEDRYGSPYSTDFEWLASMVTGEYCSRARSLICACQP